MNLKLRLSVKDLLKVLFGGSILVKDKYNNTIYRVKKGIDTYVTKE
jgi:hypothetical protein